MKPLKHREAVLPEVAQHVNGRTGIYPGSVTLEPTPWWSQDLNGSWWKLLGSVMLPK